MKKKQMALFTLVAFLKMATVDSMPSQVFWTPCTTDVQETGVLHLNMNTYFPIENHHDHTSFYPPENVGLRTGLFSWNDVAMDLGLDYFKGVDHPGFVNTKVGIGEGKLFSCAPSMSLGVFNIGSGGHHKLVRNVLNFVVGKDFPQGPKCIGGRIFFGGYTGLSPLKKHHTGGMIGYERKFVTAKLSDGKEYKKWILKADYASGHNPLGGGGIGCGYYFTPTILLVGGPTWFADKKVNGKWKMQVQLQIDL